MQPARIQSSPVKGRIALPNKLPVLLSLKIAHQHGLMLAAYKDVGNDFNVDQGRLVKGFEALRGFESGPKEMAFSQTNATLVELCGPH